MDRFVATYTMRLDAKGRVSIPAGFRAVLARDGFEGLYCQPAPGQTALDAGGNALIREIESLIELYPPYSEERTELAAALYGQSEIVKVDSEGRIILTERLKTLAHIGESVAFIGLGHKFQIWEPERLYTFLEEASEKVQALRRQLGSKSAGEPPGAKG
jgi:MraZ protein